MHQHESFSRVENAMLAALDSLIYQNGIAIYFLHGIHHELRTLNGKVDHLATAEQTAKIEQLVGSLEDTVNAESAAIQARIDELQSAGEQPDPALDAAAARLTSLRNTIAGIVPGGAEPDAEPAADVEGAPA